VADIQQQFRGAFVVQQKTVALKLLCSITLCTEADSVEKLYQVGKKKLKK
jgi:hypothetical protein